MSLNCLTKSLTLNQRMCASVHHLSLIVNCTQTLLSIVRDHLMLIYLHIFFVHVCVVYYYVCTMNFAFYFVLFSLQSERMDNRFSGGLFNQFNEKQIFILFL